MAGTSLSSDPLNHMQTMSGFLTAYWRGDKKGEAWLYTFGVAALTVAISYVGVKTGLQAADMIGEATNFTIAGGGSTWNLAASTGLYLAMRIGLDYLHSGRNYVSSTLHRKQRYWLDDKVSEAMLETRGTLMNLTQIFQRKGGTRGIELDAIDQRKNDCFKDGPSGFLSLCMGIVGHASTGLMVTYELWKMTRPAPGFEFLEQYGTLALGFAAAAAFGGVGNYAAAKIGNVMTRVGNNMQALEGSYRSHTMNVIRRATDIAAHGSNGITLRQNREMYKHVDEGWRQYNIVHTGFMAFKGTYNAISYVGSFLPAVPNLLAGSITAKEFFATQTVVEKLMDVAEFGINFMPNWTTLKANSARATGLARAIIMAKEAVSLHKESGIAEFNYTTQHHSFGIGATNIELMHEGFDSEVLIKARQIRVERKHYAAIVGESGSGKTTLLKTMAPGLHVFGRGNICYDAKDVIFYIPQFLELEALPLKKLMTIPVDADDLTDEQVGRLMDMVGLGKFKNVMHETSIGGRPWEKILSGGQKQRISLARTITVNPTIILMDEPTASLDADWKRKFYSLIREFCPEATALIATHDDPLQEDLNGNAVFDTVLHVKDRVMTQRTIDEYLSACEEEKQQEFESKIVHLRQFRQKRRAAQLVLQ